VEHISEQGQADKKLDRLIVELEKRVQELASEIDEKNELLGREMTLRRRAEEKYIANEETYSSIFNHIGIGISVISPDMEVVFLNRVMQKLFPDIDVSKRPICYKIFNVPPRNDVCSYCPTVKTLKDGKIHTAITEISMESGTHHFKITTAPIPSPDGSVSAVIKVVEDITESKQAEQSLLESEERYRIFTSLTSDYVFKCSRGENRPYRIRWMAGAVESITGYSREEILEMGCWLKIVHPDDLDLISSKLMEYHPGARGTAKFRIITKSGQVRWLKESCCCEHGSDPGEIILYGASQDITEQELLFSQLVKNQKLESLGVFAGGIAHDFNNLLTGIIANISLAKIFVNPEEKIFTRLEEAEKAADRASELTQQLLTFSKGGDPVKKVASMERILTDSISFVLRGSNVRCELAIPDDIWPVEVDEGQIGQVINNLLINSDQAMPDGGIIRIGAENLTAGPDDIVSLNEGRYVRFSIEDQGIGIPEEYLAKIFDPYFTTKQKGSGLGLATVHSIIKKHDGHIFVESKIGAGTTIHVYLPASTKKLPGTLPGEEKHPSGYGNILIMDDDEIIRDIAREILGHLGYRVALCTEGSQALEMYRKAMNTGEPFDLVIMDLTIPGGMGGKETMEKLLEIDHDVKGIVSSGYNNDPILASYRQYGFSGVIIKPYNITELGKVVHDLIPRGSANPPEAAPGSHCSRHA
jgi:PAS domain S-box-containing protein